MSFVRRASQVVAFICTLLIGAASMALIITQTAWFKEWLRGFIVRQSAAYVEGELSIGRLGGNLFFGIELEDVVVVVDGQRIVAIKDVGLDYNAFTFIGGDLVLDDIRLNKPVLRLERTGGGWNLVRLIRARTPDPDEPKSRRTLQIGEIGISDGTLYVQEGAVATAGVDAPATIERLDASLGVKSNEDELTVEIAHVSLRATEPSFGINALSGVVRRTPNEITLRSVSIRTEESSVRVEGAIRNIEGTRKELDLKASSDKLALEELARLVPALRGLGMQPAVEMSATGPLDRLDVALNVRDRALGRIVGDLIVDALGAERRVAGMVNVQHLNVAPLLRPAGGDQTRPSAVQTDISGRARFDLALPSGRLPLSGTYATVATDVQAAGYRATNVVAKGRIDGRVVELDGQADAYGGHATARGTVELGGPLTLQLDGRAENVDLRNLPPQIEVPRVDSRLDFAYTLNGKGRVLSGDAQLDESTLAGAMIAQGTVAEFRIGDGAPQYAAKGDVTGLDVQQVGQAFGIQAIAGERFKSRVNASFDVKGSGGGQSPLTLDASGTAVDSEMFGATFPSMDFAATLSGGDIGVRSTGRFVGLDPSAVTGNQKLAATLTGDVDAQTTIRQFASGVTVDSVDVAGRVDLVDSSLAGLAIDTAAIDGRYANREGQLATLEVAGRDLKVSATGAIALNETGASKLQVHAESPALHRLARVIERLKGMAVVDATITGNGRELKAEGTLTGNNLGYGESEALSVSSTFAARMPSLTPSDATVQAKTRATFVEVAGQKVSEMTADTAYAASTLQFNATGKEGVRELAAAGRAVFHPEHQEVHLSTIALRSEQIQWQSVPGSEATVNYAKNRVAVSNLQLVSGDQRLAADGVLGAAEEGLRVRVSNVDVGQLDRLFLGDQRLAGRLSASATVTGATNAPKVAGDFQLTAGAFQAFAFDSLAGTASYEGRGINLDVRLQQTPASWLTAKGYVPLSALRRTPPELRGEHRDAVPGDEIDVQVASSQIDLGVVQGFTSYLTNVAGTLQANVHVTGSGDDPHLDGTVDIRGGAFAVPDLGTNYTGLDTRLDLKSDALTIREFKVLDNRGFPMTIGGTLAAHGGEVAAVNVSIKSENFEVVDNELADLKLHMDVRVTGELRRPHVAGSVEVESGTIHVERVIERIGANPYATEATALGPPRAPGAQGLFDAVELEIGLAVPSNLVIRGNEIRPPNQTLDVGDVNVTVGGLVLVRKAPGDELRLIGEVNTIRGTYVFQGRRFEILRDGRIRFAGEDEIDPVIDIRARRIISGVETFVRVRGTLSQPELTFSSNPPLDQADILSLIVFNQPVNELGEGQQASLAQRAGALAGGYLTASLARSIGSVLDLDEFEIQVAGDDGAGGSFTVGEQFGDKLFVRVRQAFGDAQATEFILEYQLADYLRLRTTAAETAGGTQRVRFRRIERGGIDLIFFFSY